MTLARYFVSRFQDEWLVTLDGRPVARHDSLDDATEDAIALASHMQAMDHDADVMVEPAAGETPELVWSLDHNPPPEPQGDEGGASHVRRVQRAGGH